MDDDFEGCFYLKLKMREKKSQEGIALLGLIFAGALLITGMEIAFIFRAKKQARKKIETQVKASPKQTLTPRLSPLPTPSPTLTPEQVSEKKKELDQQLKKITDQFSAWKGKDGPAVDIQKQIQDQVAKDMAELKKTLSEMPSQTKQPEYPSVYNIPVQPFNPSDIINTDNMFKGLDQINKQAQEQIQKRMRK